MTSSAIKVENLSKIYRLGEIGTGTISLDLQRWIAKMRGKEDPYLTIGEVNDRAAKGGDVVYSLRDVNFELEQGEAVGIIGRNGAGKSTLLKILSRVTSPTSGRIHLKGRVASLLEVGTGFHPELTGKENIYLNGAIMGMRKKEIDKRLEEIIDFSGVERYIDTPVKRYSSGMYVRLAFAVAAHLESEILIVDEVLAVGDSEFQKKCLGKMSDVASSDGRTVLFVSHNMAAVRKICSSSIIMKNGKLDYLGDVRTGIEKYLQDTLKNISAGEIPVMIDRVNTGEARFRFISIEDAHGNVGNDLFLNDPIRIVLILEVFKRIVDTMVDIQISSMDGVVITHSMNVLDGAGYFSFDEGTHKIELELENRFQPGKYTVSIGIHKSSYGTPTIDYIDSVSNFNISRLSREENGSDYDLNFVYGHIRPRTKWQVERETS